MFLRAPSTVRLDPARRAEHRELARLLADALDDRGFSHRAALDLLAGPATHAVVARNLLKADGSSPGDVVGVGCLELVRRGAVTEVRLSALAVRAASRGQGVGARLLDTLVTMAERAAALVGASALTLHVGERRLGAQRLFLSRGFEPDPARDGRYPRQERALALRRPLGGSAVASVLPNPARPLRAELTDAPMGAA